MNDAAAFRAMGAWRDRTYLDDFLDVAKTRADHVAIVTAEPGSNEPVTLSYRQLARFVDRFAGALADLGVGRGDVVAVQLPNGWQFAALALATARLGATINPLVPIFRHRELSFMLGRTEAKVLIVPALLRGFNHGELARQLQRELDALQHVFVIGDTFEAHFVDKRWEDDPNLARHLEASRPKADDLAEIQFTSGTTGEPKGVQHTYNTLYGSARASWEVLGSSPDEPMFMASTLAHQTGFLCGLIAPLSRGAKVVYQVQWQPDEALALFEAEGIAMTVSATPFVMDLIAAQERQPRDLSAFKYFLCGGAPIPPHLVAAFQESTGAELMALWGMTENGIVTITRPGDPVEVVAGSDGVPVAWMEVRVVDDNGNDLPDGTPGRLQVRGANQTPGYFKRPDLYEACLFEGGWFDTGDKAWRRDDGGIRIAGRYKDLIIRGGENIPVADVEALLYTHPKVRELAVVGYPDDRLGERACVVVAPVAAEDPPTLAELVAFCDLKGLAKPFWPERLLVIEEMPKTPSGKIKKFELRSQLGDT